MINYLVRKGKLQDDYQVQEAAMGACSSGSCGRSCPGPQACPFVMEMPRTFSLAVHAETGKDHGVLSRR